MDMPSFLMGMASSPKGGEPPALSTLDVTENGTYDAQIEGVDGWGWVNVDVLPSLTTLDVTENGVYSAAEEGVDGWDTVSVHIDGYVAASAFGRTMGEVNTGVILDAFVRGAYYGRLAANAEVGGTSYGTINMGIALRDENYRLYLTGGGNYGSASSVVTLSTAYGEAGLTLESVIMVVNGTAQDVTAYTTLTNITVMLYVPMQQ